jgi:hypothetical protein
MQLQSGAPRAAIERGDHGDRQRFAKWFGHRVQGNAALGVSDVWEARHHMPRDASVK